MDFASRTSRSHGDPKNKVIRFQDGLGLLTDKAKELRNPCMEEYL